MLYGKGVKQMKVAVVTGANGFIGKAIVRELLSQNVKVISVVHTIPQNLTELEGSQVIECDLNHYSEITDQLCELKPDVFYHLAWKGTAGPLRGNERTQLLNVQGTCDAVRLAKAAGCHKFVFASSIMQYEVDAEIKAMRCPGVNSIYSTAKMTADYMARILASDLGMEYISALISNIYGPGEKSPRLVNSSIRKLLKGEHVSLSSGEQLYDFIFVTDAARMFAGIGTKGVPGRTYYIGNRQPRPLKDFLEELKDAVAPKAILGLGDLPFIGEGLTYEEFDTGLIYREIGIEPEISFIEGIKITKEWIVKEDCNG